MRRNALIFASIGWFMVLAGRLSISTLLVKIESSFNMNHAIAGLALSCMWFSYGLMQFPSGLFSDIKGRKVTILCAMVAFSVSYLLVGLSFHYLMFFGVVVLLGVGSGCFQTAGISMLSDLYQEGRGKALGIQASFGSMAGLVPIVVPVIAARYHWRVVFFILAGIGIVMAYFFKLFTTESTQLPGQVSIRERFLDGISALRDRETLLLFMVTLIVAATWIGFTSFYPAYLIETKGFSELEAGLSLALLSFGGILLKPLVGVLSDRFNRKAIISTLLFMASGATGTMVAVKSLNWILTASVVLSINTAIFLVINSQLMQRWEEKGRGGKLGFYRTLTILLGSPMAALIGYSATHYSFDFPFMIISGLLLTAAVSVLINLVMGAGSKLANE
jgi:MFS family permease